MGTVSDIAPRWQGRHRDNVEAGIAHLRGIIGAQLEAGRPVGVLMLEWYLERHRIDLEMARDPRQHQPKVVGLQLEKDIALLEKMIDEAKEQGHE